MPRTIVVGAGVAGLTLAHQLSQVDNVCVVEKEHNVGGLARSFKYGEFVFDIGPHRFHSEDQVVLDYVKKILADDATIIKRKSGVYLDSKYHDWPLRPNTLLKLKPWVTIKTLFDLIKNRDSEILSFEDYIKVRYGDTLFNHFFKKYTEKFTHTSCDEIHPLWAESGIDRAVIDKRIKMNNLSQVIKNSLLPKPVETNFIYPASGMQYFNNKLADSIEKQGGVINSSTVVSKVNIDGNHIKSIVFNNEEIESRHIYWSAPLTDLSVLLGIGKTNLRYLSTVCFNIEVNTPPKKKFQWCYYGNDDTIFVRATQPVLFSKSNAPKGKSSICVEVTCFMNDGVWKNPESIVDRVIEDIEKVGLAAREEIINIHIEKVANTYPLYTRDYPQELERIISQISDIENLTVFGRCGKFFYNNMDHSIKEALDISENRGEKVCNM